HDSLDGGAARWRAAPPATVADARGHRTRGRTGAAVAPRTPRFSRRAREGRRRHAARREADQPRRPRDARRLAGRSLSRVQRARGAFGDLAQGPRRQDGIEAVVAAGSAARPEPLLRAGWRRCLLYLARP